MSDLLALQVRIDTELQQLKANLDDVTAELSVLKEENLSLQAHLSRLEAQLGQLPSHEPQFQTSSDRPER